MSGKKRPRTKGGGGSSGRARRSAASPDAPSGIENAAGVAREELDQLAQYHDTSPALAGGDLDADWQRAASSGEESVGGTVATPDQDVVDDLGRAVGVPRAPDEPFRASSDILDERDRRRGHEPE
jgi:uncharacterized protein DUF6335